MLLKEVIKTDLKITDKKAGGVIGKLYFPWIVGDKENLNKRIYSSNLIKREVQSFNKKIEDSGIAGQITHPIGVGTRLDKVSHIITKLEYDEREKKGYAEAKILDTTAGRDLLTVVNQNLKDLGASLRTFSHSSSPYMRHTSLSLKEVFSLFTPAIPSSLSQNQ